MSTCKCTTGSPAPASRYNKASACQRDICSLHTVVIPKSKGSDAPGEPYAPQNGGYQNAIVVYEATGAVYLFDEKGIMTNLTGSELVRMVESLQQQMQTLTEQTDQNTAAIATETENRVNAQTQLQTALDVLQTALTAETNARTSADSSLNDDIVALQERVSTNTANLVTETAEREQANTALQTQVTANTEAIAAETTARESADTTLTTKVEGLQSAVEALGGQIDGDLGKVANLPDSLVQGTVLNSSTENNNITMQTSSLDLSTGNSTTDTQTAQFKTINGESIVGEGNIPVEGGGSSVEVVQATGTSTTAVMSQNAVTEALDTVLTSEEKTKLDNLADITSVRADELRITNGTLELAFNPVKVAFGVISDTATLEVLAAGVQTSVSGIIPIPEGVVSNIPILVLGGISSTKSPINPQPRVSCSNGWAASGVGGTVTAHAKITNENSTSSVSGYPYVMALFV